MLLITEAIERSFEAELREAAPDLPRVVLRESGPDGDPTRVRAAFFSGDCFPERMRPFWTTLFRAEKLEWLHTFSAGVDHPVFQSLVERGVLLTTSSGAAAVPIAQTVAMYLLMLSRDAPGWLANQAAHRWAPRNIEDLASQQLVIVGLGPIGLEVARLGAALRMRVLGLRRSPRGDEPCEVWPMRRLGEALERADWLVLALPLTDDTRHLVDGAALARLKPGARLVNIGRGELVDEPALIEALRAGRVAGAALDVFETEPLPQESPLWSLPNVLVTPHSAGTHPGNLERAAHLFLDNLARWTRGQPLLNVAPRPGTV
ncbi:MAG: D-2-hydroxyacid dehydrogenase [Myxococcota bacterium]